MGIPPNPAGMCVDCIRSQVRRPAAEISKRASPPKTHGRATHPTRETGDERVLSFSSVLRSRCECARDCASFFLASCPPSRPPDCPRSPRLTTHPLDTSHENIRHVSQVDITEGIQKQCTVLYCKECQRYLQPPKHWIRADLESKELLTFCIKRIKGLNKVKLVDAGFIWTEPHSKRLKTKLTIQKEVLNGAILQQTFVTEFVVEWHMCDACSRAAANSDQWTACVQVRQKVEHKRTFLFLEQLILKHGMEANTIGIKSQPDGLDFYYGSRSHGLKMVDFLQNVVPVRARHDKQLVSHNANDNTYNYQYTFMVEIVPICKEDIVVLPFKVSQGMGGVGPLMLVTRVGSSFQLTDPHTMKQNWMDAAQYYRLPYRSVGTAKMFVEYVVLDIEPVRGAGHGQSGKWLLADVQVARVSDFGVNDNIMSARTHLGHHLQAGDTALGYDLASLQIVDPELEKYRRGLALPDVLLVKKSYQEKRRRRRAKGVNRQWKLQRLDVAEDDVGGHKAVAREAERAAMDEELFMQELEEDEETRAQVQIFRDDAAGRGGDGGDATDDDDDVPEVPIESLLDGLSLARGAARHQHEQHDDGEDDENDGDHEMMD